MKKQLIIILLVLSLNSFAQTNLKDYKTVFYQEVIFETDDYKMYLVRCFSREDILKLKIRVFNKTKDIIYIKPEEFQISINGKPTKIKGRPLIANPEDEDSQMIDVMGEGDMRVEKFEVALNSIYKLSMNSEAYAINNTEMPAKKGSEVVAGPFKCEMTIYQANKEKSFAKYSCVYSGDKIGIIEPNKTVAIMSTGKENYNSFPKPQYAVIEKGQEANITIEFRKMISAGDLTDGYQIKWNDAFKTSALIPLKAVTVPMLVDLNKSEK